jgi:hypothetical protein
MQLRLFLNIAFAAPNPHFVEQVFETVIGVDANFPSVLNDTVGDLCVL